MSDKHVQHLGERIRILRKQRGWSQETLALEAQINTSYLGQIERMECSPTIGVIQRIADALGVGCHLLIMENVLDGSEQFNDSVDIPQRIADELTCLCFNEQIAYYKLFMLVRQLLNSQR